MSKKSQAEFAVILGIILIALLVAVYSFGGLRLPGLQPPALSEEQEAVDVFVTNAIKDSSIETLKEMYDHGGYLEGSLSRDPLGQTGSDWGENISYWQKCNQVHYVPVEEEFVKGVKSQLESKLQANMMVEGISVAFDKSYLNNGISVEFFDNKATVTVNLPTSVAGQAIPQPYRVDVDTKAGRIFQFAKDFSYAQAHDRIMDSALFEFMLKSYYNPAYAYDQDYCWLPMEGSPVGYRMINQELGWAELKTCMERFIGHMHTNTIFWQEPPTYFSSGLGEDVPREWAFRYVFRPEILNDKGQSVRYTEFGPTVLTFSMGTRGLDQNSFNVNPNPVIIQEQEFSAGGAAFFPIYSIETSVIPPTFYDVRYPIIVSVLDTTLRQEFKFAVFVNIVQNDPYSTDCIAEFDINQSYVCDRSVPVSFQVKYADGDPVANADIKYMGCQLTPSDGQGTVSDMISPYAAFGQLSVKPLNSLWTYNFMKEPQELIGVITIPEESSRLNVYMNYVDVRKSGSTYQMLTITPLALNGAYDASVYFYPAQVAVTPAPSVSELDNQVSMPVTSYNVVGFLGISNTYYGWMNQSAFIPPSTGSLYIYLPRLVDSGGSPVQIAEADANSLISLYDTCGGGIDMVSTSQQTIGSCTWP